MTQPAHAFLRHILPTEGYKCATVITETRKFNRFFGTTDELADFVLTQDALGATVYHACASFKTNENRKTPNVLAAKALWADIDAGEGKAWRDAAAAYHAVCRFCRQTGLPGPTLVSSGYGLHAYWPLVQNLDLETWQELAGRFKLLCEREGLHADPARTADASSILRTPGTHNRKHGGFELVQAGDLTGPYRTEELGELNAGDVLSLLRGERRTPTLVSASSAGLNLAAAATNIYPSEPANPHAIADQCGQFGLLRGKAGRLPEPHWYAALGLAVHCANGEKLAHEWSSGHPTYSQRETQDRLDRAHEFGPTTCVKFESVNPTGCAGCRHKGRITSPIQLGRLRRLDTSETIAGLPVNSSEVSSCGPTPPGFILNSLGLWFETSKDDKNVKEVISTAPIWLDSIQVSEIAGDSFSLCFKLELPHSQREIVLPAKVFFSSHGMSEMHGRGAVIHDPDLFRKYVREAMDIWHKNNNLEVSFDQFGWKRDELAFLFGDKLYTASSVTPIIGSDEIKTRSAYLGPNKSGSLERWSRAANALFTKGCEPQSFALLSSFAAPLMRFHSSGEGGAIVSLVSDQSGSGKTTALEGVASVWGRLKGTQLTDDDTRVSKGLTLGVLGNLPCVYDELYNRDPEVIRQFVLMFTNGRDKMRGTQDGKLRHSKAEWQTLLVLASNNSIVDILSSMDGTDAPAFRLLEFNCVLPPGIDNGDNLKRELAANSGWAGDTYLRTLLQPETLAYVKKALPTWTDSIWKRTGLRAEHRFWVRTLASVVAAGVLVRHSGILDFSVQRILDWACDRVSEQAKDATITGVRDPVSSMSEFLHSHIADMLVVPTAWKPQMSMRPLIEPRRELLIRYEVESGRAFILEAALRKWLVKKGIQRTAFLEDLRKRQVMTGAQRRVTLGAGTDYASGQVTVFEVNMRHPAMSGVVLGVEQLVPKGPQNTHAERVANFERR